MNERPDPQHTHRVLTEDLRESIGRLRHDLEARSDPLLEEVAHALQLLLDLASHAQEDAADNRRRIDSLQAER